MKLSISFLGLIAAQYEAQTSSGCGPTAAYGGAYWPSLSAEHPCGVNFWSSEVKANSKCQLQLISGASYFLSLGGVFVTTPASDYNANTFYFHTYDNWQGQYGASVVNFWQNADFPSNSSCYDADQICISCTQEPDADYDGYPDAVQGVYLGNFMHDFRHDAPSQTNVPIANSNGHINGTVYTIQLNDQYGQPVPITNIASHYGHEITSATDADGVHFANDGKFDLHVGCTDFEGQFLYFSFTHQNEMEANGWYSMVTASYETLTCPEEPVNWESAPSEVAAASTGGSYGSSGNPYAADMATQSAGATKNKDKNKNTNRPNRPKKPGKQRSDYDGDYSDDYYSDDYYQGAYDQQATYSDDNGAYYDPSQYSDSYYSY